jgi:hypothetical protein
VEAAAEAFDVVFVEFALAARQKAFCRKGGNRLKSGEGEASLESSGRAFQCKRAKAKALPEQMQGEEGHDKRAPTTAS